MTTPDLYPESEVAQSRVRLRSDHSIIGKVIERAEWRDADKYWIDLDDGVRVCTPIGWWEKIT